MVHPQKLDWTSYLDTFHASHPGITEEVLVRAHSNYGLTPFEWVVAPIAAGVTVLDLACGSGPCIDLREGESWIGLDRSKEELARARSAGQAQLIRGDATTLPFRSDSFDAVVCSMALMLVQPLGRVLDEVSRVLRNDGTFTFTMPCRRPLRANDVVRYAQLVRRLGRWRLRYPNDRELSGLSSLLEERGLDVVSDARERFRLPLRTTQDSDQFVHSLYLPDATRVEVDRGLILAARWVGSEIGIPLRRVVVRRRPR